MKIFFGYLNNCVLILILVSLPLLSGWAIDNPEAPDYVGQFKLREKVFLQAVEKSDNTTLQTVQAYYKYGNFLDKELNTAYHLLVSHLDSAQQKNLQRSQRAWLAFRDAEFAFIDANWTRAQFGDSYVISRGDYRSAILRTRVMQLLNYAKNYQTE